MGSQPRLEREKEFAELRTALQGAASGGGRTVLVEGVAGIGKSELLRAAGELAGDDFEVLSARGSEYESDFAYGLVHQLLGPAVEATGGRTGLFEGGAAPARALFTSPVPAPADVDGGYDLPQALHLLVARLSAVRPLLVLADDVHLADEPSLRFLAFLGRRAGSLPLLLMMAARPRTEWRHPGSFTQLTDPGSVTVIRPAPLSESATAVIVERAIGRSADPVFVHACFEACGGNPFYLGALLDEAVRRERPGELGSARSVESIRDLGPESIRRSVVARLTESGPEATAFAVAASVLGADVSQRAVAAIAGLDEADARRAADALRDLGLLRNRTEIVFAHPILSSAVYAIAPVGERAALHRKAASVLRAHGAGAERVAGHLLLSDPAGDPDAVETLREAAAFAAARGASETAVTCLRRALAEPPTGDRLGPVLMELGLAEARLRRPEAREHLLRAIETCTAADDRLTAAIALWTNDSFDGRYEEGMRSLERLIPDSGGEDPDLRLRMELEVARGLRSSLATAADGRERIALLRDRGWDDTRPLDQLALGLIALDDMFGNAPAPGLADLAERALPTDPGTAGTADSQLRHIPYYVLIYTDRFDRARERLEELISASRSRGSMIGADIGTLWLALLNLRQGRLAAAEGDARRVLRASEESGWRFGQAAAAQFLADTLIERAEPEEASAIHADHPEADIPDRGWTTHVRFGRARLSLETGDPETALSEFEEVGRLERSFLAERPAMLPWRSEAARAATLLGRTDLALRLSEEEVRLCRSFGAPRALGIALRAEGMARGGEAGAAALEESVAVLESSGADLEFARSLVELGAAKRRAGDRAPARPVLRRGLDTAVALGAEAVAIRAREELAASGARLRRERVKGPDALTASELRVARLAAAGRSNPEIANRLFVSRKTVEKHLASAYTKLEIASRADLSGVLPKE